MFRTSRGAGVATSAGRAGACVLALIPGSLLTTAGADAAGGTLPGTGQAQQFVPQVGDVVPGQLLVRYRPGVSEAEAVGLEKAMGLTRARTVEQLGVHVVRMPAHATDRVLATLSHHPAVEFAEHDGLASATRTPNDYWWPSQWSPVKTNAPAAWDITTGSSSGVVAVLDSGVDFTHPDLQGKLVVGRDIVNSDADPTDDHGHGTMVSGIIGAASNNTTGVTSYCWTCSVMPVKVLAADGRGSYSDIAAGITWAADRGAKVINMSLGGASTSSTLSSAVSYASDRNVVLVAAAGNSGSTSPTYPAAHPKVIAVAATDSTDTLYTWSNRGSWAQVAAPGTNVTTGRNAWYGDFAGTSSASPVVAGIAGLAASAAPGATKAQIDQAILSSASSIGSSVSHGRVDAHGAVTALTGGQTTEPPPPAPSPETTTTTTYSGSLTPKTSSRSFLINPGAGALSAQLSFSKATSLTLDLVAGDGRVLSRGSGTSPLDLAATVTAGPHSLMVSGASRASFTLTVTHQTP